ncbi:MAG TPA: limonene-1,2-epoxide hydrolase family protein [Jatrophihabitantaceae bacterium]|nr:limonene-1,2-epoxide hydrolase family protein [Jatrophihabitantaceae bacterium]
MPFGLAPVPSVDTVVPTEPQAIVEAFLAALADNDFATANALLDPDVVYVNVGLPTIRGSKGVIKVLSPMARYDNVFEVYLHSITTDGGIVATERTDVLNFGPLRLQFWVWGRFDVRDGRITLWRDSFDYLDMTRSLVRGLLGIVIPGLRPKAPTGLDTPPGRH